MKFKRLWKSLAWGLLAVSMVAGLVGCGGSGSKRTTKELETTTYGIDVSRFQGVIDWQQVAQSGVDYAMIRVGYRSMDNGGIVEDSSARYNMQEAAAAGIPIGVYFFSTAISQEEAMEEAQWVAEFVARYPITYPVVYDCEGFLDAGSRQLNLTKAQRTDNALAFLKTIKKLGYEPMFYASRNQMEDDTHWEVSRIDHKYKVWVAQYPEKPYPETEQSSYSGKHQMWQYSTEGSVPGITQNVDLNVCYFGYDGIEPAKNPEPPRQVGPDVEALMNFQEVSERVTAKEETNLRSVPSQGEESQVVHTLKNGEFVPRVGISDTGWSKLIYQGRVCYAVSSYLVGEGEYVPAASDPDGDGIVTVFNPAEYYVTAKEVVNLRSIPSATREDAEILGQLKNGEYVLCVGVSDNGWSKLDVDGKICYAVSSYLTEGNPDSNAPQVEMAFEDVEQQVVTAKAVNLRTIPSTDRKDAEVVTKLEPGTTLTRTGINKDLGWSRVKYRGRTLYCVSQYLNKADS